MATPFTADGDIDFDLAMRLADYLFKNGTDTLVLVGTTGESPTLSEDEQNDLFRIIRQAFPNQKLMAGTGSNCTRSAIAYTQAAEKLGLDACLQVVPYYNKPSQEGIFCHFKAVADATSLPILLYNIPGRTGVNMAPETVARLAQVPFIVGIKEAAGSVDQVKAIRALTPPDFLIYSGDDAMTLPFMAEGAVGVVSVASHLAGGEIARMVAAFASGDTDTANAIEAKLAPLFKVLFIGPNPSPLKYALTRIGFPSGTLRLPLVEVTDAQKKEIDQVLSQFTFKFK